MALIRGEAECPQAFDGAERASGNVRYYLAEWNVPAAGHFPSFD